MNYEEAITLIDKVIFVSDYSYLENKNHKIEKLEYSLENKENKINELNQILSQKEEKIKELEQFKRDVLNSNSWKYTKVLRQLRKG